MVSVPLLTCLRSKVADMLVEAFSFPRDWTLYLRLRAQCLLHLLTRVTFSFFFLSSRLCQRLRNFHDAFQVTCRAVAFRSLRCPSHSQQCARPQDRRSYPMSLSSSLFYSTSSIIQISQTKWQTYLRPVLLLCKQRLTAILT